MKKAIALIIAALFVFALTSVSFAAEAQKAAPAPAAEKKAAPAPAVEKKAAPAPAAEEKKAPAKVKQVTGEVKAVDAKAMTLTVTKKMKGKAEDTAVTVNDKTKITMGKDKKVLADVKVGDKVTVKYSETDGKMVAKSIAIKAEEKKAEPAAKPAEKKAEPAAKPAAKPAEKK
jgi:ribosomal protein S1